MTLRILSVPLTVDTNAYATGDLIGTKITIPKATLGASLDGIIRSIVLDCKSSQTTAFDIVFFNADPTATTFTDNAAIAVAVADFDKIIGGWAFAVTTSWIDVGTPSFAHAYVDIPYTLINGTSLYAALISRGTPTFAATDLTLKLGIEN